MLDAAAFDHAPKKSIDYAVMERTEQAALIPADIGWSDVGNWRAVWELRSGRAWQFGARQWRVMDAANVHVRSDETLTTVIGVNDVIVVTTQDAVLVLHQDHGNKVRQLVANLKQQNRREAGEHKRIFRPCGQGLPEAQRHPGKITTDALCRLTCIRP